MFETSLKLAASAALENSTPPNSFPENPNLNNPNPEAESKISKGVAAIFWLNGVLNLLAGLFSLVFSFFATFLAYMFSGGNSDSSLATIYSLSFLLVGSLSSFLVAYGCLTMKKWIVPILGISIAINIIGLMSFALSGPFHQSGVSAGSLIANTVLLYYGLKNINYFKGKLYVAVPIVAFLIARVIVIVIALFSLNVLMKTPNTLNAVPVVVPSVSSSSSTPSDLSASTIQYPENTNPTTVFGFAIKPHLDASISKDTLSLLKYEVGKDIHSRQDCIYDEATLQIYFNGIPEATSTKVAMVDACVYYLENK